MTVFLSVSWDDSKKRRRTLALVVAGLLLVSTTARAQSTEATPRSVPPISVIVEAAPNLLDDARSAVDDAGGVVNRNLSIIDGFAATVPSDEVESLRSRPGVLSVTPDGMVRLNSTSDSYDASSDAGSMSNTDRIVGAQALWAQGLTGDGVDVGLIDSGVVPVDGLAAEGKIVSGPDLSADAGNDERRDLDAFGHGTHMAGVIAGRDDAVVSDKKRRDPKNFVGVAPDARIVSVKVADAEGRTSLSRVLDGIDWVVSHRAEGGLNIRVLNLSFGTEGWGDCRLDPLAHAVDRAWNAGIVVVVAAGNRGVNSGHVDSPACDPQVIAVGADDPQGTTSVDDDVVPDWSSSGDGTRNPDIVAPGRSIVSLRDPGSYIDQNHPAGRVADRFFRGSGTSPAAAVVSGAAAILLQQRPELTPDDVKSLLTSTASVLPGAAAARQGSGLIDLRAASDAATAGSGSSSLVSPMPPNGSAANTTEPPDTSVDTWAGNSWSGDTWSGNSWSGNSWSFAGEDGQR
jgi:serine protease AprX